MNTCLKFHFLENFFPEIALARIYIWPKLHFSKNVFFKIDSSQKLRLAKITLPRKLIFQKLHFSKVHFLEIIYYSKNHTVFILFISNKRNRLLVQIKRRKLTK